MSPEIGDPDYVPPENKYEALRDMIVQSFLSLEQEGSFEKGLTVDDVSFHTVKVYKDWVCNLGFPADNFFKMRGRVRRQLENMVKKERFTKKLVFLNTWPTAFYIPVVEVR